jgi:hypothetical protein
MLKVQMMKCLFWLLAHPKPHLATLQHIKRWPLRGTRNKIYAIIARNLTIGGRNYKKKVVDMKKHGHTQKIATIDEQTFLQGHVLNNESWYIDSKASQHLTFQRYFFSNYKSIPKRPSTWAFWVQSH